MSTVTVEDVRRLIDGGDEATLVIAQGRARVVPASALQDGTEDIGLVVASRAEALQLLGHGSEALTDEDVQQLATRLDTAVSHEGG